MSPVRIQRKRTKGWRMPPNTVYVGRTAGPVAYRPFANPFRIGGYFKIGVGRHVNGFMWLEARPDHADASFTRIETAAMAVEWFVRFRGRYPYPETELAKIRGKNLMCFCRLCDKHKNGKLFDVECADCAPCHADPLGIIANAPASAGGRP